ncbi:hypothetical protein EUTSA_v10005381mg [Eutrema salsugineum]|uniref:F-box domain-containing protein n=1 Tax=Eutrema salsugineum TaxID=72664 RepID=V4K161_EUTSA|nr:hypothetical protein EUTSA_v10005381mg [Eutrema salsugineum]
MKRGSEYYPITKSSGSFVITTLYSIKSVLAFLFAPSATQRLHFTGKRSGDVNIPLDLVVEMLKKLPAKSLVRFRCVSKQWSSIIGTRRDFLDSIVTRSLAQPQRTHIIFHHRRDKPYFIFTSTTQKIADNESIYIPALTRSDSYDYVRGLILCWSYGYASIAIYNPTTRQALWLPEQKHMHLYKNICFLGYDPLENQYKVLSLRERSLEQDCQVFTLSVPTAANKWRNIKGIGHHYPVIPAICINGAIYYQARTEKYRRTYVLVSFDVRSEKLDQVKAPETLMNHRSSLINFHGKLGFMCCQKGVEIWFMEQTDTTQEWSRIFFHEQMVDLENWSGSGKGVTRGGEIVFFYNRARYQCIVAYYDPKRNSMRYEDINDIDPAEIKYRNIFVTVVTDHVENTMCLY